VFAIPRAEPQGVPRDLGLAQVGSRSAPLVPYGSARWSHSNGDAGRRSSQLVVQRLARGAQLLLQDSIGGTDPGVTRVPLPLQELRAKQLEDGGVAGVGGQVLALGGVAAAVEELPAVPVVVLVQGLVPVGWLPGPGAVEQVLESGRDVEVLVDGEGHLVVEVVDEAELLVLDGSHGVVHGHLVVALAAEGGGPGLLRLQRRQQRLPGELHPLCAKDAVRRVGDGEPVQNGRRQIWRGREG